MAAPTIHSIREHRGIAGQFELNATVEYPGEPARHVAFIGSVYGGPVVMRTAGRQGFTETFVTDPGRFGEFGTEWVQRFFEATA